MIALRSLLMAVVVAGVSGCGSAGPSAAPPAVPDENDSAYRIERVGAYYLIGNALTPGHDELELEVFAPDATGTVDVWLDGGAGVRLDNLGSSFGTRLDIAELGPGEHELLLAADGSDQAFARVTFKRTHPLYVVVSTDWDDADNSDQSLRWQEEFHELHPELKITHFVGPYTFTEPEMTADKIDKQVSWVKGMQETYGDEIGLHIHPYCSFVESAGLDCKTEPSFVYEAGDATGYTVMCAAYSEEEFTTLLEHADELFQQHGLGKPTSFRAGGWTANLPVLRALGNAGYVADTSANNWSRMEEWKGQQNGVLYDWNQQHWATIGDTSQPYYPSQTDILVSGDDHVPVLQVPDNGILVDYVSAAEMVDIFHANWGDDALEEPINFSIGWHPGSLNETHVMAMHGILNRLDRHLASNHDGPVVYETLTHMTQIWPAP